LDGVWNFYIVKDKKKLPVSLQGIPPDNYRDAETLKEPQLKINF